MRIISKPLAMVALALLPVTGIGCCFLPFAWGGMGEGGMEPSMKTEKTPPPAMTKECPPCPKKKKCPPCPTKEMLCEFTPSTDIFSDLYFDFNQWYLSPISKNKLDIMAGYLKGHPYVRVQIEGNCGSLGSESYNMKLGGERALEVKNYLVSRGIDANRLDTVSYGKNRLFIHGCRNLRCNAVNRRVSFLVTEGAGKAQIPVPPAEPMTAEEALKPIYFDNDQSYLGPDAVRQLDLLSDYMKAHPEVRIRIAGNCGTLGSEASNEKLGEERAYTAMTYLVSSDIPRERLETVSYGKDRPVVADCTNEQCNAPNRRDDFTIIK